MISIYVGTACVHFVMATYCRVYCYDMFVHVLVQGTYAHFYVVHLIYQAYKNC